MLLATCLRQATRIRTLTDDLARVRRSYATAVRANRDLLAAHDSQQRMADLWRARAQTLYLLVDSERAEHALQALDGIRSMLVAEPDRPRSAP